jgi:hypothetical protein
MDTTRMPSVYWSQGSIAALHPAYGGDVSDEIIVVGVRKSL